MDLVLKKETARRIVEIKNTNIYTNISVSVICGRKNIVINPAIKITHPIIGIFVLRVFRNRDTLTSLYLDSPFPNESKCSIVFCGTFLKRLHSCRRTHIIHLEQRSKVGFKPPLLEQKSKYKESNMPTLICGRIPHKYTWDFEWD